MAKHKDYIRAIPGGTAVASNAVTLKKHVDDSTVDSGTTDAAGLYEYTADGSPGPLYEQSTVGSTTKKRSGKSTGQVGTWWLADHPKQMRSLGMGVVPNYTDVNTSNGEMTVTAGTGLQVKVDEGLFFIDGDVYNCTAQTNLSVTANSSGSTRIDRIIVRYTREGQTEEGKCVLMMLDGTPGAGTPPALTNDSTKKEFSLAQLSVVNGAASFSSSDITDERYSTSLNQAYAFAYPTGIRSGDIFGVVAGKLARLGIGTSGQVLRSTGSVPAWSAIQASDLPTAIDAAKINTGVVSNTEFNYLDGVTSAIQTQLNAKAPTANPTFTGTVTGVDAFFSGDLNVTGGITTSFDTVFGGIGQFGNFKADSSSGSPSIAATPVGTYPGAGTSPSGVTVSGGDAAGRIAITIGTSPSTGDLLKVTFFAAKANSNYSVFLMPRTNNATTATGQIKIAEAASGFTINVVSSALNAGSAYGWDYFVCDW